MRSALIRPSSSIGSMARFDRLNREGSAREYLTL